MLFEKCLEKEQELATRKSKVLTDGFIDVERRERERKIVNIGMLIFMLTLFCLAPHFVDR